MTYYSGLAPIFEFFDNIGLIRDITREFKTTMVNATKFKTSQLMLAVITAFLCGISRLSNISIFTSDILVKTLLGLPKGLNKDVISTRFKALGEARAQRLENLSGQRMHRRINKLDGNQLVFGCRLDSENSLWQSGWSPS